MTDHLSVETTDRGFDRLPSIPSEYGGKVTVHESSAASGPHVWLRAEAPVNLNQPDGPTVEAPIHLTAENAWRLADQLRFLVRNHYQGDVSPAGDPAARERLAQYLFVEAEVSEGLDGVDATARWAGDAPFDREPWRQFADEIVAVIAGKED